MNVIYNSHTQTHKITHTHSQHHNTTNTPTQNTTTQQTHTHHHHNTTNTHTHPHTQDTTAQYNKHNTHTHAHTHCWHWVKKKPKKPPQTHKMSSWTLHLRTRALSGLSCRTNTQLAAHQSSTISGDTQFRDLSTPVLLPLIIITLPVSWLRHRPSGTGYDIIELHTHTTTRSWLKAMPVCLHVFMDNRYFSSQSAFTPPPPLPSPTPQDRCRYKGHSVLPTEYGCMFCGAAV